MFCFWTVIYLLEMSIEKMAQRRHKLANIFHLLSKIPQQHHFSHCSDELSTLFHILFLHSCYTHPKSINGLLTKNHEMLFHFTNKKTLCSKTLYNVRRPPYLFP